MRGKTGALMREIPSTKPVLASDVLFRTGLWAVPGRARPCRFGSHTLNFVSAAGRAWPGHVEREGGGGNVRNYYCIPDQGEPEGGGIHGLARQTKDGEGSRKGRRGKMGRGASPVPLSRKWREGRVKYLENKIIN